MTTLLFYFPPENVPSKFLEIWKNGVERDIHTHFKEIVYTTFVDKKNEPIFLNVRIDQHNVEMVKCLMHNLYGAFLKN